jgi:hypothetical protein
VAEEVVVEEGFKPKTFKDFSKNKGPFDNVEILGMSLIGHVAGKMPDGTQILI